METQTLNYIPETVLKKRRNREQSAVQRAGRHLHGVPDRSKRRRFIRRRSSIKKPEQFVWVFRQKELDLVRMKNRVKFQTIKRKRNVNSKLLFVIRINGSDDMDPSTTKKKMHPSTSKILKRLRLPHIFNGIFLKTNEAILNMLVKVEPYVTYGKPNLKSVRELILKKGCGLVNGILTPLTDNNIIEQALGKYGILCIEDMVHEIETIGPHFKDVNNFLQPFNLMRPKEKVLQKSKRRFKDGGDSGDRADMINDLISKMVVIRVIKKEDTMMYVF